MLKCLRALFTKSEEEKEQGENTQHLLMQKTSVFSLEWKRKMLQAFQGASNQYPIAKVCMCRVCVSGIHIRRQIKKTLWHTTGTENYPSPE